MNSARSKNSYNNSTVGNDPPRLSFAKTTKVEMNLYSPKKDNFVDEN